MTLIQDFKNMKWPGKATVLAALLSSATLVGYGNHVLSGGTPLGGKKLEQSISDKETLKLHKTEDGKPAYTLRINETQKEGYTIVFKTENAFNRFDKFRKQYIIDHEEKLNGRDYLTPKEVWDLCKIIDDKKYTHDRMEITETNMDVAEKNYNKTPEKYLINFDTIAPKQTGKEFDLEAAIDEEYSKLEAAQEKYLEMCRKEIQNHQKRIHDLRKAAEAAYQRDLRSNADYQRARAEFNHYRR